MNLEIFNRIDKTGMYSKIVYLTNNYPKELDYVLDWCDIHNLNHLPFAQKIYHVVNHITILPECNNNNCNNNTKFATRSIGYYKYCCTKCSSNDKVTKDKKNATSLKRYGTTIPQQTVIVKNKAKKTITNKLKENPDYINNKVEKMKQTSLKLYGVDNINKDCNVVKKRVIKYMSKIQETRQKIQETYIKKYGVVHPWYLKHIHDKTIISAKQTFFNKIRDRIINKLDITRYEFCSMLDDRTITINCLNKQHEFKISRYDFTYRHSRNSELCTICNPIMPLGISQSEKELVTFIKTHYKGKIVENTRKLIHPYEVDIYLPELNLAFEYNGLYWHSEARKDKNYHLLKSEMCSKKDIVLIHIWEDDWHLKQEIIKSMILQKLQKSIKIYARKCVVNLITPKQKRDFLIINHIQGDCVSKTNLGLFYDDELVAVMTFGKHRIISGKIINNNSSELLRFCNKLNHTVVGGASKLLKNYITLLPEIKIITSYANIDRSTGNVYTILGFKLVHKTPPNYFWWFEGSRKNRFNYRKNILVEQGFDSNLTESEIMHERGALKIYDAGSYLFELNLKE